MDTLFTTKRKGLNAGNKENVEKRRRKMRSFPVKTPVHRKRERDAATEIGRCPVQVEWGSGSGNGNDECRSRNSEKGS
jgi:hypothetical protein